MRARYDHREPTIAREREQFRARESRRASQSDPDPERAKESHREQGSSQKEILRHISLAHTLAHPGSLWLVVWLSLWPTIAKFCSYSPYLAHKALARFSAPLACWHTWYIYSHNVDMGILLFSLSSPIYHYQIVALIFQAVVLEHLFMPSRYRLNCGKTHFLNLSLYTVKHVLSLTR